jgi:hypothetical protein
VTGNPRELLFYRSGTSISGMFLPSLRRFVIHVPSFLLSPPAAPGQPRVLGAILLSDRELYVVGRNGELWGAAAPTA